MPSNNNNNIPSSNPRGLGFETLNLKFCDLKL